MNIIELKRLWEKEKVSYESKEIGDGVQKFVKEILKSDEVFKLNEGLNSTPLEKRKYEFKEEEIQKVRHADIVIFINQDIIIPVEVEKYKNIKAGEKQILQYQLDWNKKYGILTDGYTWRFYNNNMYKSFILDEILDNIKDFLDFWNEYIKPEFYYLSFFEPQNQRTLLKMSQSLLVEDEQSLFFEDITKLIAGFKNKLKIEGYFASLEKKEKEKRAVEITYAYIVQFILYKTLVDNLFAPFDNEFAIITEKIHNNLKTKSYKEILGLIDRISSQISANIYHPFSEEQKMINHKLKDLSHALENQLADIAPWLDIFIFVKKYDFKNIKNEIFGYIYENYLKELYEESQKGQYFTDPAVVNFMLGEVGYASGELKERLRVGEDKISVIDPACGSGTFLYSAVDKIISAVPDGSKPSSKRIEALVNNNIFGLDIEEFPLYLAEMSIIMRMLQLIINEKYNNPIDKKIKVFKTKDSIAEFLDTPSSTGQTALAQALNMGYDSYVRDETDLAEMKSSLKETNQITRRRFDYVIANPPYIGYNKASKSGLESFKLIKKGKLKLNNIYGVNLHSVAGNIKKRPPKPDLWAFFIALGLALLKRNGKICYIIPQTIMINPDLDVIRYHLSKFTTIKKIIIFNGKMFIGRGLDQKRAIPTSSLIFVAENILPSDESKVEIIKYNHTDDSIKDIIENLQKGKNTDRRMILQKDLLENVLNWNFIKQDKDDADFYKKYKDEGESFSTYYTHDSAEHQFKSRFYFDEGYDIDEREILDEPLPNVKNYSCEPILGKVGYKINKFRGYWPDIRAKEGKYKIRLLKANQGYHLLDSKYKIIWSYNRTTKFFFVDAPIIWARNKILAIGSENLSELYYLFAILNSRITDYILRKYVKIADEDTRTILVSLQIIKDQLRLPKITTKNKEIKAAIIDAVGALLEEEDKTMSDYVDFNGILIQKFDTVYLDEGSMIMKKDDTVIKRKIKAEGDFVKNSLSTLELSKPVSLMQIKHLKVIDEDKQNMIKNYIDDLVFALYFQVTLKHVSFSVAREIHEECDKNKFYKLLEI
jgi:type I restriction-modification system DNA methylase subunit